MAIPKWICFFLLLLLLLSIHPNAKYMLFISSSVQCQMYLSLSSAEKCEANVGTRIYLFEHCNINRVHQFKEQVNYFMAVHLHITCFAMYVCCAAMQYPYTLTYTPHPHYGLYCYVLTLDCRHVERTLYRHIYVENE